jgi:hypothetical protein
MDRRWVGFVCFFSFLFLFFFKSFFKPISNPFKDRWAQPVGGCEREKKGGARGFGPRGPEVERGSGPRGKK